MSKLRGGTTAIDVNASSGAYVSVTSTIPARKVTIQEDETVAVKQGLTYQLPNDGFTATYTLDPGVALVLGNTLGQQGSGLAPVLGIPAQQTAPSAYAAGTTYSIGNTVTSGGLSYVSIQDSNTGNTPASSPTYWTVFTQFNLRAADTYLKVRSATTTVTKVKVLEEE